MKKKHLYILITILINCVILFFVFKRYDVNPERYSNAESYIVNIPYMQADSILQKYKQKNTKYKVIAKSKDLNIYYQGDTDGVYRYYLPEIGYEVECITLPMMDAKKTHLLLTEFRDLRKPTGWEIINFDPNKEIVSQNELAKKTFEDKILKGIGRWQHYRSGLFR